MGQRQKRQNLGKEKDEDKEGGEKRDMFYRILFQELASIRN